MNPSQEALKLADWIQDTYYVGSNPDAAIRTIAERIDRELQLPQTNAALAAAYTALRSVVRHTMPDGSPCWCNSEMHARAFAGRGHSSGCSLAREALGFERDDYLAAIKTK